MESYTMSLLQLAIFAQHSALVYSHLAEMKWTPDATFGLNVNIWFGCYTFTKRVWECLLLTECGFLVKAEYSPNQVQKCLEKKQGPAIFGLLWSRSGTVVRVTRCSPGLSVLHTQLHSVWMQNYMIVPVATHSSILAWRIPWTKEACRL